MSLQDVVASNSVYCNFVVEFIKTAVAVLVALFVFHSFGPEKAAIISKLEDDSKIIKTAMNKEVNEANSTNSITKEQQFQNIMNKGVQQMEGKVKETLEHIFEDKQTTLVEKSMQKVKTSIVQEITQLDRCNAARIANSEARNYNLTRRISTNTEKPIVRLVKAKPGLNTDLYWNYPNLVHSMEEKPVGTPYPSSKFPATMSAVFQMSMEDINYLRAWANEDFGIMADDNLETCQHKFQLFIMSCGYQRD